MRLIGILIAGIMLAAMPALAVEELPDPGTTPDSPFYFMDSFFDNFRAAEKVSDERAAEMVAMARENNQRGMEKAMNGYQKALNRSEDDEEMANKTSNHLAVLGEVYDKVPEQAKKGIERAMNSSARGRERALERVRQRNPERASELENSTGRMLGRVRENARARVQEHMQGSKSRGNAEDKGKPGPGRDTRETDRPGPDNISSGEEPSTGGAVDSNESPSGEQSGPEGPNTGR
ncbi:MAG: hypothetical protein ACQEP1_05595 [Nanobdellota archaeon]